MARKTSALESAEKTVEQEEGEEVEEEMKTTSTRKPTTRQAQCEGVPNIDCSSIVRFFGNPGIANMFKRTCGVTG